MVSDVRMRTLSALYEGVHAVIENPSSAREAIHDLIAYARELEDDRRQMLAQKIVLRQIRDVDPDKHDGPRMELLFCIETARAGLNAPTPPREPTS